MFQLVTVTAFPIDAFSTRPFMKKLDMEDTALTAATTEMDLIVNDVKKIITRIRELSLASHVTAMK